VLYRSEAFPEFFLSLPVLPGFLNKPFPPGAREIGFVSKRLLLIIMLVVFFGRVEGRGRQDRRYDAARESSAALKLLLGLLCQAPLLLRMDEDGRLIGSASVPE